MLTTIFLLRHAKSVGNIEKRFQGKYDAPLSELGVHQSELLKKRVSNVIFDVVYFSPLKRAKQTALIAFSERKVPLIEAMALMERDFGKLDGIELEKIKNIHPEIEAFYDGNITDIGGFDVEAMSRLQERSFTFLEETVQQNKGKKIALVGHLFWIKSLLSKILNVPYTEIQKTRVGNASITIIHAIHEPKRHKLEIKKIGDETHLE